MQQSASPPRPGSRRGPPLSVQTSDLRPSTAYARYSHAHTYATSTQLPPPPPPLPPQHQLPADAAAEDQPFEAGDHAHASRRQSKLNFRLFSRNRSTKRLDGGSTPDDDHRSTPSEHDAAVSPMTHAPPLREKPSASRMRSKKGKPARPNSTHEPPPLFEAYPQSVKEGLIMAPAVDAESVLRVNKVRAMSEGAVDAIDATDASPDGDGPKEARKRMSKRRNSTLMTVACVPKLYILTTSGWLLQYAADGCYNRLPERVMQLRKDSAAFASDAIPGKHWVLQISQSANDAGAVLEPSKPSVFSKLSFGHDLKKPVSTFLLVMTCAEDMNSWLVTVRKEIQSMGGREYRPDEKASAAVDPSPVRSIPPRAEVLRKRSSMYSLRSPPGGGLPPVAITPQTSSGFRSASHGSSLSHRASMYVISPASPFDDAFADQPPARSEPRKTPRAPLNLDKALPDRPVDDAQARIDALGIINAEKQRQSILAGEAPMPLAPRGSSGFRSPLSPKFPVSAYNPEARMFAAESPQPSPRLAPLALRHHRFSFEQQAAPAVTPPQVESRMSQETSASSRPRAYSSTPPSLTDGESAPQESLPGDIPVRATPVSRVVTAGSMLPAAVAGSPPRPVRIAVRPRSERSPPRASSEAPRGRRPRDSSQYASSVRSSTQSRQSMSSTRTPKRQPSVEPDTHVPVPVLVHAPAPYPVPNSALPALPLDIIPPRRPSSAQDHRREPPSPLPGSRRARRPSSFQPPSPATLPPAPATAAASLPPSTLRLPTAAPLTIQERRRLSHRPIAVVGPPTLPPPRSPLPQLPKTAGAAPSAPRGLPTPPPFKANPPTTALVQFPPRKWPESPSSITPSKGSPLIYELSRPGSREHDDIAAPGVADAAMAPGTLLSPVAENWRVYLEEVQT